VLAAIHADDVSFVIRENALMVRHADVGWRKFSDLSDGQQRIAANFCDLAIRCASLNSHLGEKAIAEHAMGVTPFPQRSKRWHDMKAVAADYYALLEVAKKSTDSQEVQAVKLRLDALIIPPYQRPRLCGCSALFKRPARALL
jgi:hypothetical protein